MRQIRYLHSMPVLFLLCQSISFAAERLPVPAEAQQKEALELLKEVFGKEMESRDAAVQRKLAGTMLHQADDPANDAAMRYVLLLRAAETAAEAGDQKTALAAVKKLGSLYQAKTGMIELRVLGLAAKEANTPAECTLAAQSYLDLCSRSIDNEEFDIAKQAGREAFDIASKANNAKLMEGAKALAVRGREAENAYAAVSKARRTLKDNPDDPQSNEAVGRYLCFMKNEWDNGLTYLSKSDDEALAAAAKTELNEPAETESQVVLGDAWFALAEKEKDELAKSALMSRAKRQYYKALPKLGGLVKIKIEKQIAEASKSIKEMHRAKKAFQSVRSSKAADRTTRSASATADNAINIGNIPGVVFFVPFNQDDIHLGPDGYNGRFLYRLRRGIGSRIAVFSGGALQSTKRGGNNAVTIDENISIRISDYKTPVGTTPRTIALWVRCSPQATVDSNNPVTVLACGSDRKRDDLTLQIQPGAVTFKCEDNSLSLQPANPTDGKWHHFALTFDGTDARGYFDGRMLAHKRMPIQITDNKMFIGRPLDYGKASKYLGDIDEICVFDRALSPEEIALLARPAESDVPEAKHENPMVMGIVDLLQEHREGHWKDLVPGRGKWMTRGRIYRIMPTGGAGPDFGWAWPLPQGLRRFRITKIFRMSDNGAIQVVFTEKPNIIDGYGVALSYKWYAGFSAGNLRARGGPGMVTVPMPEKRNNGFSTLVIDVDADTGITATLDGKTRVSWRGRFDPTCVCISGDEFVDWYINKFELQLDRVKPSAEKPSLSGRYRLNQTDKIWEFRDDGTVVYLDLGGETSRWTWVEEGRIFRTDNAVRHFSYVRPGVWRCKEKGYYLNKIRDGEGE